MQSPPPHTHTPLPSKMITLYVHSHPLTFLYYHWCNKNFALNQYITAGLSWAVWKKSVAMLRVKRFLLKKWNPPYLISFHFSLSKPCLKTLIFLWENYVFLLPTDGPGCPIIKKPKVWKCSANLSRALQIFIS